MELSEINPKWYSHLEGYALNKFAGDMKVSDSLRKCKDCGIKAMTDSELELFSSKPKNKFGKHNRCKKCYNKRKQAEVDARGGTRALHLKREYNMTLEDYDSMLVSQNGVCKICKKPETKRSGILVVDHCHDSLKVRGLLCDGCNKALGLFRDSKESILSAYEYLNGGVSSV